MKIDWIITLSIKSICFPGYITVLWNHIYLLTHKPPRFTFSELLYNTDGMWNYKYLFIYYHPNLNSYAKCFSDNSLLKISQVWNYITPDTFYTLKLPIYLLWPKRNNKNGLYYYCLQKTLLLTSE